MLLPEDYLNNVDINDVDIKDMLMTEINDKLGKLGNLDEIRNVIDTELDKYSTTKKSRSPKWFTRSLKWFTRSPKWVNCVSKCKEGLKPFIDAEITSTAYMLRLLAGSVVKVDEKKKLVFEYKGKLEDVTGVWRYDRNKFTMSIKEDKDEDSNPRRLIMGFGPSASGKTHWTKKLIEMISHEDPKFPKIFLSIDGGIAREKSHVYQKILKALNKHSNIDGFKNLVSTIGKGSLFESDTIKKAINEYLGGPAKIPISLYVPTTASGLSNPYSKYQQMTGDNKWIGVYIWQHLKKCPFIDKYKCETTRKAGKKREKIEGKKFSKKAYTISELNGRRYMKLAPGGRIDIHNSGSPDKGSIITEYGIDGKFLLTEELVSTLSTGTPRNLYKHKNERKNAGDVSIIATIHVERFGGTRKRRKRKCLRTRKKCNKNRKN
jgi:Cdc6-like AAA superfamily ATPase